MDNAVAGTPGRRQILVIEDDPVVRFNIVSYLEDSGYTVAEADSGEQGVAVVRDACPDLVLCDLRMPGMDGLDVLRVLGAELPDLPTVVVSGTGVLSDAVEALRTGAWDFVTKPIQDMAVLEHAIDGALDKARLIRDNRHYQVELQQANALLQEHLEQFRQDAAAGRSIQQQLMPPAERRLGAYRLSCQLLPSLYLSGDFVDNFVIDHRHIGFFLADVSGHGMSSAFVTVLLKSFMQRYQELLHNDGERTILSPAQTLARLNRDLLAQRLEKYLTMLYGVLDVAENRLCFANGGHLPGPVLFDGTAARYLEGRGPPVGLFADAAYENIEVRLPDRHLLALFSDGVLDALPERHLRDKCARLLQAVSRKGLSATDVLRALGLTTSEGQPDDITLLILERED